MCASLGLQSGQGIPALQVRSREFNTLPHGTEHEHFGHQDVAALEPLPGRYVELEPCTSWVLSPCGAQPLARSLLHSSRPSLSWNGSQPPCATVGPRFPRCGVRSSPCRYYRVARASSRISAANISCGKLSSWAWSPRRRKHLPIVAAINRVSLMTEKCRRSPTVPHRMIEYDNRHCASRGASVNPQPQRVKSHPSR